MWRSQTLELVQCMAQVIFPNRLEEVVNTIDLKGLEGVLVICRGKNDGASDVDMVMDQLDPSLFFRANRQYIVAHRAVKEIYVWPIGRLALALAVATPDRIIISKARVPEFKTWYTQ